MRVKIILILIFLFHSVILLAQEKYEFCIIEYFPKKNLISISKNNSEHSDEIIETPIEAHKSGRCKYDSRPLLARVILFQEKDWEVMSFNTNLIGRWNKKRIYSAYLRRKIK